MVPQPTPILALTTNKSFPGNEGGITFLACGGSLPSHTRLI